MATAAIMAPVGSGDELVGALARNTRVAGVAEPKPEVEAFTLTNGVGEQVGASSLTDAQCRAMEMGYGPLSAGAAEMAINAGPRNLGTMMDVRSVFGEGWNPIDAEAMNPDFNRPVVNPASIPRTGARASKPTAKQQVAATLNKMNLLDLLSDPRPIQASLHKVKQQLREMGGVVAKSIEAQPAYADNRVSGERLAEQLHVDTPHYFRDRYLEVTSAADQARGNGDWLGVVKNTAKGTAYLLPAAADMIAEVVVNTPSRVVAGGTKIGYHAAEFNRADNMDDRVLAGLNITAHSSLTFIDAVGLAAPFEQTLVNGGRWVGSKVASIWERGFVANSGLTIAANPANGNPAAIARGIGTLNTRQTTVLEQLSD
ncbi:hypothetical protein N8I74_14495 [Chitiniphilus purpureus]|uniref:Phage major capsid protein n=1 Tax=Chitiniphilus purpureus TaxID=2981137 RepID=A0ABY6DRI0_9NEIS|nr:hypothetical protein [Chitiniphilus sp. CD1]UXY14518.1 hypothetical protein N8I74_14495 [Chitiniphilus sp. CD1]